MNDLTDKNLYSYCDNNPVLRSDDDGEFWQFALAGGGVAGFSWSALGSSIVAGLGAITPVGWIAIGVTTVVAIGVVSYSALSSKEDPDPYRRADQKKQGRERKNKARQKDDWQPRSKPKKPKKHTPGRDHRKKR